MGLRRRHLLTALVAVGLLAPAAAQAAPPANDNWGTNPVDLTVPAATVSGTTVDATLEFAEPTPVVFVGGDSEASHSNSVWYRYQPTATAWTVVDTCASAPGLRFVIAVFRTTGSVTTLDQYGATLDGCDAPGNGRPRFDFLAEGGTQYSIMVANYADAETPATPGPFTLHIAPRTEPLNNDLADAVEMWRDDASLFHTVVSNVGADKQPDEPNHAGVAGGSSVWYRWTAPGDGSARAASCALNSDLDPVVGVYLASSSPVSQTVASNDDAATPPCVSGYAKDSLTEPFAVSGGREYKIAVDTHGGLQSGDLYAAVLVDCTVPGNDAFAAAGALSGAAATANGSTCGATKQAGEPDHAGDPGGASVWYRWTAPASGSATVDLAGSDFDTLLGVYSGNAVDDLTEIAAADDSAANDATSRATFAVTAGTLYRIAVDSRGFGTGNYELALDLVADQTQEPPPQPPPTGGGPTVDRAACDAAEGDLAEAERRLKKAKQRLKKAKRKGDRDAIGRAKAKLKKAKRTVAAAEREAEQACAAA